MTSCTRKELIEKRVKEKSEYYKVKRYQPILRLIAVQYEGEDSNEREEQISRSRFKGEDLR